MKTIKERAKSRIDAQTQKGEEKYGMLLDENQAPVDQRLDHLAEELADGLQYVEWIKDEINKIKEKAYTQALEDICLHFKDTGVISEQNLKITALVLITENHKKLNPC